MSVRTSVPSRTLQRAVTGLVVGCVALIALLLGAAVAAAGAQPTNSLSSIEPADGATLQQSPDAIVLVFNEEIADDDIVNVSVGCDAQPQDLGLPAVDDDGLVVTVEVRRPIPRGACIVGWDLKDALDAPIANGSSTFSVINDAPATTGAGGTDGSTTTAPGFVEVPASPTPSATESSDRAGSSGGAIWLGRVVSTIAILMLFGGLALISVGWPEGPEYVVTVRYLRTVWAVGLVATIVYLIAFASDFNDTSFGAALNPSAWLDLKDAGWAGRGALLRLLLVSATGWVAMRPERIIDPTTAMWAWGLPAFSLVAVALSRVTEPLALIGFVVGVAHVFAAAIWFGGAALVARVVLAGPGEDDLVQATRAFSRVSIPAILVAVVTGIVQMLRLDGGSLFSSSHGRVVLLKVLAVAAMLAVALAARQQVTMRLDRAQEMTAPLADRFRRAFGAEAMLGVVVLAFSSWLLALTPPRVDPLADESYAFEIPFVDQTSGVDATVSIGPARVGLNGIKVEVAAPEEGITNLTFRFVPPVESGEATIQQAIPLQGAGTAWLDDAVGLPFGVAGTWTIEMEASTAQGVQPGAQFTFPVAAADGSTQTATSSPTNTTPPSVLVIDQSTTTAGFVTSTTSSSTSTSVP